MAAPTYSCFPFENRIGVVKLVQPKAMLWLLSSIALLAGGSMGAFVLLEVVF